MDFEKPSEKNFTIYSKSGCINCRKVKDLLKSNNIEYEIIDFQWFFMMKNLLVVLMKQKNIWKH